MKHPQTTLLSVVFCLLGIQMAHANNGIVHDGEYEYLRLQHGQKWDAEDKEIDKMSLRHTGEERWQAAQHPLYSDRRCKFRADGQPENELRHGRRDTEYQQALGRGAQLDADVHRAFLYTNADGFPHRSPPCTGWTEGSESCPGW